MDGDRANLAALDHEAVAYLNRLGQFWYFAKAMRLKNLVPKMTQLVSFRLLHLPGTNCSTKSAAAGWALSTVLVT